MLKARGDREQDLWRYRLSEGCVKQWCDKPSGCGCLGKKCVSRGSNEVWTGGAMKCEQGEQWSVSRGSNEVCTGGAMKCEQEEQWSVSRGSNEVCTGGAMKCEQGEQWSSDLAVSHIQSKLSDIQSENTRFRTYISPLPRMHIDVADRSVLPLLFLKSLCILSFCPIVNIRSCQQDRKLSWVGPVEYHPHSGFHYSKHRTYLCRDNSSISNISGLDLG